MDVVRAVFTTQGNIILCLCCWTEYWHCVSFGTIYLEWFGAEKTEDSLFILLRHKDEVYWFLKTNGDIFDDEMEITDINITGKYEQSQGMKVLWHSMSKHENLLNIFRQHRSHIRRDQ